MSRNAKLHFEVHVTVSAASESRVLEQVAADAGAKVTEIVLDRGRSAVQPMLTFHGFGTLRAQMKAAQQVIKRLDRRGVEVVRIKLEVGLEEAFFEHDGAGRSRRRDAVPDWAYAEQHIRVRLHSDDADRLRGEVVELGAHVSMNARATTGEMEERFVTSRVYNTAENFPPADFETIDTWSHREYRVVTDRFETVAQGLRDAGWGIVDGDREVVVHDTNHDLDSGWLPDAESVPAGPARVGQSPASWPTAWTLPADPVLEQPRLFDPSMKHLSNAYRRGDPSGPGSDRWLARRTQIFDAILSAVAGSTLSDSLCVRGSVLLRRYLGGVSRNPGDIDWVVTPSTVQIDDEHGLGIIEATKQLISSIEVPDAVLHVGAAVSDSIWTYDRVPGRRLTVPWSADDVASGTVQMDFVFGEELWTPALRLSVDGRDGNLLQAASPELSLAWKLLWLATDMHPQGKDLYDAVLLAEAYAISPALVERALAEQNDWRPGESMSVEDRRTFVMALEFDLDEWNSLVAEYPHIDGTLTEWTARLANALFPPTAIPS